MEVLFEIRDAEEGGYFARALGHSIFTQADSWEELRANVLEATSLHFEDGLECPQWRIPNPPPLPQAALQLRNNRSARVSHGVAHQLQPVIVAGA